MPYSLKNPPERIKGLPKHAQEIWIKAYNNALKQYNGDETRANKVAWAAVKKGGYKQNKDGKWVKGEGLSMNKLQQFIKLLISDAKSVWKSKDAEQEKQNILSTALRNTTTFSRDSYIHAVFADVVIVRDYESNKYYALEYSIKNKDEVTFGDYQEVEMAYIPSEEQERAMNIEAELLKDSKNKIRFASGDDGHEIRDVFFAPCIAEEKKDGIHLRGMFAEADLKNDNDRIYPEQVLANAVEGFQDQVIIGMDGHPALFSAGSYRDVALKFESAQMVGKQAFCDVKILDTAAGKDLQVIANEKIPIGLSMRGYGEEKYDKKLEANVVQEGYKLVGIDAVLEPAFAQAKVIREQKEKQFKEEGGENMDELKEMIAELQKATEAKFKTLAKELTEKIQQLESKDGLSEDDRQLIAEVRVEKEKIEEQKKATAKVAELLESDEYKDYEFKDSLRKHLEKCETVAEVEKTAPRIVEIFAEKFKGQKKEGEEPTSIIIQEKGFFGGKGIPTTIKEAYDWMLDPFEDTGIWMGKSRLDNPRYNAKTLLDNYLKFHIGGGSEAAIESVDDNAIFKKNRANPLFHLIRETIGDAEMYTGDVAALAAYQLPLYVLTMQDMMNIVNQCVGILPIPKPTAKIPFKKVYYGDGAATWTEINQTNFSRTQAAKAEGATPQLIKIKTLTNDITLETALKLMYEWTIEAEQDLRAYYGLNVDSDSLQEARNEIMRELSEQVLYALLTGTSFSNSDNCVQATGSPLEYTEAAEQGYSKAEWLKFGLTKAVKQADALINKQPHNVKADVIIVDAAKDYLFTEPQFVSQDKILTNFGLNKVGTYQAHYKVFTTTCADYANKILLTHRGGLITQASHLFLPYVLFWMGGKVEQNTGEFSRTVMSRFANTKVYGQKVAVIDIV